VVPGRGNRVPAQSPLIKRPTGQRNRQVCQVSGSAQPDAVDMLRTLHLKMARFSHGVHVGQSCVRYTEKGSGSGRVYYTKDMSKTRPALLGPVYMTVFNAFDSCGQWEGRYQTSREASAAAGHRGRVSEATVSKSDFTCWKRSGFKSEGWIQP
jgi:hypothetical protein